MYEVSTEYKESMNARLRNRSYMTVSIGVVNQEAQANGNINGELTEWSNKTFPWDSRNPDTQYATMEQNYFKADGSMTFLPEGEYKQFRPNVGIATQSLLGEVVIEFPVVYDIKGLTIKFGEAYPLLFQVITDEEEYEYENDSDTFSTTDNLGSTTKIVIKALEMVGGRQRLRIENILMGVGINFTNTTIQNATYTESINAVDNELPSADFNVTVADDENVFDVDSDDSFVNYLESGQPVNLSMGLELADGSVEFMPVGNLKLTSWQSEFGKMNFSATSVFAFLDFEYPNGNSIHERTLYDDAVDVLTYCGFKPDEYLLDDCLKDVIVTNPLQGVSCAEALQLIANAGRCIVYQNRDGLIIFKANFATVIDPDNIVVTSDTDREFSNPHNTMLGTDYVYADMTQNFFSADGSMYFLPENGEEYLETGFVSSAVANEKGVFDNVPSLTIELPAGYTYYGLSVIFDGNAPKKMRVQTYHNGRAVTDKEFEGLSKTSYIAYTFKTFDKMVLSFPEGAANNRVLVNKISFGDLTDYRLSYDNILGNVTGYRETKTKDVNVKVFTFVNDEEGNPQEVDDEVYVTQSVNSTGETVTFENPLISSEEHAYDIAKWLGNYYANNVSYSCEYRGEPRLNASDIIYLESKQLNNLQVEIETHNLSFNGSLKGSVELRRALRMINN